MSAKNRPNPTSWRDYIEEGPSGPVVKMTGIPVGKILNHLERGFQNREILQAYAKLTPDELEACREYQLYVSRKEPS
jgi:uncharacterized protein (DUF433 family)